MLKSHFPPILMLFFGLTQVIGAQSPRWLSMKDNHLVYGQDGHGNRIPDFSTAGYEEGDAPLPKLPVVAALGPSNGGDDTVRIQAAINAAAKLPLNARGFRGALLLKPGTYHISGMLELNASGIVLRGSGTGLDGTILVAEGQPHTILRVGGAGEWHEVGASKSIVDAIVPVGAKEITVHAAEQDFSVGDHVIVQWHMTDAFIHALGMDRIPARSDHGIVQQWTARDMALHFDRRIMAIKKTDSGRLLTLDAPLTQEMHREEKPVVFRYNFPERISQAGVENLRTDGAIFEQGKNYDTPIPHKHNKDGSFFESVFAEYEAVENAWMTNVIAAHFNNIVRVQQHARAITIRYVKGESMDTPHSDNGAPFAFNVSGQQVLVEHCDVAGTRNHVWTTQALVAGPNVFRDSTATGSRMDAGPHQRWATGILYEQLHIQGLWDDYDKWNRGSGHGWSGAYNLLYNSDASEIQIADPPNAYNWAINDKGAFEKPQCCSDSSLPAISLSGPGEVQTQTGLPESLYEEQLRERLFQQK